MCDGGARVMVRWAAAWLAVAAALAAPQPAPDYGGHLHYDTYSAYPVMSEAGKQVEFWNEEGQGPESEAERTTTKVTQKRAALVLDRLLVALQHALREERAHREPAVVRAPPPPREPLAAPLQHAPSVEDLNEMTELQRRGQTGGGRGRVLRCYFNAVTCF